MTIHARIAITNVSYSMTIDACDHIVEISYFMVIERIEMFYDAYAKKFYSMAIDACDTSRKFPIP